MENITIGYIIGGVVLLAGFIKGVTELKKSIKEWISGLLKESFDSLSAKLTTLQERVDEIDVSTCKNFLVARLAEIERGHELDEIETERFWEQYEHYLAIGGNTYIKRKVEQFKAEGKI